MPVTDSPLVGDLRDQVGDGLRAIAEYDQDGYEVLYLREDVATRYSRDDLDVIYEDMVLESMRSGHLEQQFHGGAHQCSALGFEEMLVFQFVRDEFEGFVVSVDRGAGVDLNAVMATCHDAL